MFRRFLGLGALALLALISAYIPTAHVAAQTPNFSTAISGVVVLPFHISGQYTANTTAVIRFAMPFDARVVSVQASARASGGTTPTLTVDVLAGGVSILSAPVAVTAGSNAFATIATAAVADEAAMTVNLAIGGTSPTWNDIVVVITVVRV